MYAIAQPLQKYRELQINTASPLQRILMVYDVAIVACRQRDLKRATDALNVLRSSLDMEQGDVAIGFYRLYQYCADLARAGRFDEAADILKELVEAWVQVLVRETGDGTNQTTTTPERVPVSLSLVS